MKTLIFSDTHASDRPNEAQMALLQRVITSADRVIINGDFWDRYLTTFDRFINSSWRQLFPLLKKRKTIYLVGNHDLKADLDDQWQLFADQLKEKIDLKIGRMLFHIEHGHQLTYSFGSYYPRLTNLFGKLYPFLDRIEQGGHFLTPIYRAYLRREHDDRELLSYAKEHNQANRWHVFGHSHLQRKSLKEHYLNPGSFRCGVGHWLFIDGQGTTKLYTEKYG